MAHGMLIDNGSEEQAGHDKGKLCGLPTMPALNFS